MIPGNMDPRRPEKVQRYKAPQANGNAPVEDLTPDYMNILGPDSATANAEATAENVKSAEPIDATAEASTSTQESTVVQSSNGTNVIPTSPQYGVAIISNNVNDIPSETTTSSTDTVIETTAKSSDGDNKDMHSTPSRNDRFKVVKIASLEPFRRGRWKCMDYVDENPPPTTTQSKTSQSQSNIQMGSNMYMQTQSLPQQHFQQMLVQGSFTNQPQFYQNMPTQMMQSQYFYPAQNVASMQQMQQMQQNNMQPQFINANQQYFPPNVVPHSAGYNYQNMQYVSSNIMPNQTSAFVSTTQNPQLPPNFQQSQTYAGPPSSNQANIQQPMVNGHTYTNETPVASSLPTQVAKNVILSANPNQSQMNQQALQQMMQQQSNTQQQINQQYNQGYVNVIPSNTNTQNINQVPAATPVASTGTPGGPIVSAVAQSIQQLPTSVNPSGHIVTTSATLPPTTVHFSQNFSAPHVVQVSQMHPQSYDPNFATNVYTNPQFVASVNSLPLPEQGETQGDNADVNPGEHGENVTGEEMGKLTPVVNAIDNKIEQAMDLVKSHLMYTVREEVEVLKEKIAELMERIQQLETENAYLKQQILTNCKGHHNHSNGTPDPPPPSQ